MKEGARQWEAGLEDTPFDSGVQTFCLHCCLIGAEIRVDDLL